MARESICFAFCGPIGVGKNAIQRGCVARDTSVRHSVSTTTRAPRADDVDGVSYRFVDTEEFERRIKQGLFLEHATFNGHLYGTEARNLTEATEAEYDLVMDIEVQGARQLRASLGSRFVIIFVLPPTPEEMIRRAESRGTESSQSLRDRLNIGVEEFRALSDPNFSDYLIVNDDLDKAISAALAIIHAERYKMTRRRSARFLERFAEYGQVRPPQS